MRARFFLVPIALAILTHAPAALADVSSWLALGAGYSLHRPDPAGSDARALLMSTSLGVGSTPTHPVIVGGVLRMVNHFSVGTDLGLSARIASRSFVRGDWGLAFDGGVVARTWSDRSFGRYPVQATATFGAPFGFQFAVGADLWDLYAAAPSARGVFGVFELDLLRLTVMRSGDTTTLWPNPSTAGAQK